MYDWLIVGGGIHGVHLAIRLLAEGGVNPESLCILDPHERLLSTWRRCTATTGMSHLRSPFVHHLGLHAHGLKRFAGRGKARPKGAFAYPYDRPSLSLFNAHCDQMIEQYGLADCHVQDRVVACDITCDGVAVQTAGGQSLQAQRLVLALGSGEQRTWPSWAPREDGAIRHIFEENTQWLDEQAKDRRIAVIGGGISAYQVALRLSEDERPVHLISRHSPRPHQFDSDPGWLGPRFMGAFEAEADYERRRGMITEARNSGSVPPALLRSVKRAIRKGRVVFHEGEVLRAERRDDGVSLDLGAEEALVVDQVLLATGFSAARPGGTLVDALIKEASLPCASCGYPIVDSALRWHPRIYVSGPLAELELGPVARNIAGAQRAGNRLIDSLQDGSDDGLSLAS